MVQKLDACLIFLALTISSMGQTTSTPIIYDSIWHLNTDTTPNFTGQLLENWTVFKDSCLSDYNIKKQLTGIWFSCQYSGSTTLYKTPPKHWVRKFEIDECLNVTTHYSKLPEGQYKDYLPDGNGRLECDNKTGDIYLDLQFAKYKIQNLEFGKADLELLYYNPIPPVRLELFCDKAEYKIGDTIKIECWISNLSDSLIYVQSKRIFEPFKQNLSIIVMGVSEFRYDPYMYKKLPAVTSEYFYPLHAKDKLKLFEFNKIIAGEVFRKGYWMPVCSNEESKEPFQSIGEYIIRFEYLDILSKIDKGIKGPIVSEVRIVISD